MLVSSNCRTIMIESGKQDKMIRGKPDFIVKDLVEAYQVISSYLNIFCS